MNRNSMTKRIVLILSLIGLFCGWAYADRNPDKGRTDSQRYSKPSKDYQPKEYRIDKRYQHDRYYPPRGYTITKVPEKRVVVRYHDKRYYYYGGIWYRPYGPRFVVVAPPIGLVIPVLPPYYTTVWVSGIPYYYANDVYYIWDGERQGYVVTTPPEGVNDEQTSLVADELFIYPKEGQSEQQQSDDRYACHQWGVKQTGYDPTQPPSNLSTSELNQKREDYQRAMKACLEGRGYSVR